MNHAWIIFRKQLKDILRNKTVLIQFLMFPVMAIVMTRSITIDGLPENYFVSLFAPMYVGMAPLTGMAAIVSEEKEKNTLRVLRMAGVGGGEYLLGTGGFVWLSCLAGSAVLCACGSYTASQRAWFLSVMALGILISILLGASIGAVSRTQMMATSLAIPVMMLLAFLPMLSQFNASIASVSKYLYSQQISGMLASPGEFPAGAQGAWILAANAAAVLLLFLWSYRRCELS